MLVAVATALLLLGSALPAAAFGVAPGSGEEPCDPGQMPCTGGGAAAAGVLLLAAGAAVRRRG